MLEWTYPGLLLLLALLPLLRWLHRRGPQHAEVPVSALFLWPRGEPETASGRSVSRPDPRWWLRAAIAALLLVAAAGPQLVRRELKRVDVYLDESPSLRVREAVPTRLELAAERLAAAAREARVGELRLLSLRRRAAPLDLDPDGASRWTSQIAGWVEFGRRDAPLPAPAQLAPGRERWLVTDGADPALPQWLEEAPVHRVIQVGRETENSAVTLLALRPSPGDPARLLGIVRVRNGGLRPAERYLEVSTDERMLLTEPLDLEPGATAQLRFELRGGETARVRATVEPADALPEDDALTLTALEPEPVSVRVDGHCPEPLRRALRVHPGLVLSQGTDPALGVWCSEFPPRNLEPLVWFRQGGGEQGPGDSFRGKRVIEVSPDVEMGHRSTPAQYAVFVSELLDRVAGRALLDRSLRVEVAEDAVQIAPRELVLPEQAPPVRNTGTRADLSGISLALAALLLLLDTWRTRRRRP